MREALRGRVTKHHRFLLRLHLQQIDTFDTAIAEIDAEVDVNVKPFRTAIRLLTTIPEVRDLSARTIAAEIGNDMARFPTERRLISWAGLARGTTRAPGNVDSTACAKALPGSRPPSFSAPGPGSAREADICRLSFTVCERDVARGKRSVPSQPPS